MIAKKGHGMASAETEEAKSPDAGNVMTPRPKPRRRISGLSALRWVLLLFVPIVAVAIAAWLYLAGGRFVSTDNAYARASIMHVTNDIAGMVKDVMVHENDQVKAGAVLFRLDDEPYRIALAAAEAQLGIIRNDLQSLQATYQQNLTQIEQAQTALAYAKRAYSRAENLQSHGVSSKVTLDEASRDRDNAMQQVDVSRRAAEATLSQLGGNPRASVENHPRMLEARAAVDKAKRDLERTTIIAQWDGIVANVENLRPGTYLAAGDPAMSLVGTDDLWIEANPKETDLTYLKTGDPATVTVDAYPGVTWKATITSVSPATGAEFSVLPPQNASGNWVKVVQRVPVKLAIEQLGDGPQIRAGMSVNVEIDTGHQRSLASLLGTAAASNAD